MQQDITKLSIVELKALAYDTIARVEIEQQNLKTINIEINKKQNEPTKEVSTQEKVK